jgi:hypothetical protein
MRRRSVSAFPEARARAGPDYLRAKIELAVLYRSQRRPPEGVDDPLQHRDARCAARRRGAEPAR